MKCKMEQDRIPDWKGSTAAQWAAIRLYALATPPVTVRAALWQRDTARGERFTQCLDFLLKDIAKKHEPSLTRLLVAQPVPLLPQLQTQLRPRLPSEMIVRYLKPSGLNIHSIC